MTLRSTLVLLACALAPAVVAYQTAVSSPENPPPPRTGPVLWAAPARDSAKLDRPPNLAAVAIGPGGVGLAVGAGNRAWRTEDGGFSWSALPGAAPAVSGVFLGRDGLALAAAGRGRILRSLAGGTDWTEVRPVGEKRIFRFNFVGGRTAYAVGDATLLRSDDSGETWTELDVPAQWWDDVAFVDEQHGWLVGGGGYGAVQPMRRRPVPVAAVEVAGPLVAAGAGQD
jgi:photosystem II stability/assembly factor-like uncharacterized protein